MKGIPFRGWSLLFAFALGMPLPVRGQPLVVNIAVNTAANPIGRVTSAGNGQMRRFYEYDPLGRVARTEHRLDGGGYIFTTTFGYPQGIGTAGPGTVLRTQSFPDGEAVAFGYDASGAQRTITTTRPGTVTPQDVVRDIRRNARGETISVTYGNGVVSTHSYNDTTDLRLNRIQTTNGTGLVQDYLYGFDANGNVTSLSDGLVPSFSATYGYDSLDRLTSMTSGSVVSYQYDSVGNLINKEGTVQTYGGTGRGPHALATAGATAYTYDFNGNVAVTSAGLALTWNAENMATQASLGGVVKNRKSFVGEELWKKLEGGTTTLYLPSLLLENGVPRKFFGIFAERSPDGSLKFYHGDHLGSSTVVTDATQAVVHRIAYMPYGADRGVAGGSFAPRYQFNFKEKESTGLYDYGARLYDPATGRWLSADSSLQDGPNRYAYVSDNPLAYVDPTGHFEEPPGEWPSFHYQRVNPVTGRPGTSILPENGTQGRLRATRGGNQHVGEYGDVRSRPGGGFKPHDGVDINSRKGSRLYAVEDGTVVAVRWNPNDRKGYGSQLTIRTRSGADVTYSHLSGLLVIEGSEVRAGQLVAFSGVTGNQWNFNPAKGEVHLHFEVRLNGRTRVDPLRWLNGYYDSPFRLMGMEVLDMGRSPTLEEQRRHYHPEPRTSH
jgi:RHS repeat-associated protein